LEAKTFVKACDLIAEACLAASDRGVTGVHASNWRRGASDAMALSIVGRQ
jgi:hypothetical protein